MKAHHSSVNRLVLALVIASVFALSASGAGFIKFDGVDGESQAAGHLKDSDVLSWSWGVHRTTFGETGATRTRGGAVVQDLTVTKVMDKASIKLLEAVTQGKVYPLVTLTFDRDVAGSQTEFFVVTMKNVMVTSYSIVGSETEDRPTEAVTLNMEEFTVTYEVYDSGGTYKGNVEATWKIEEG